MGLWDWMRRKEVAKRGKYCVVIFKCLRCGNVDRKSQRRSEATAAERGNTKDVYELKVCELCAGGKDNEQA